MSEDIANPAYWRQRLKDAPDRNRHHALYLCSDEKWAAIEAKHRELLRRYIGDDDFVLDAGCGWGRLFGMMPETWYGGYIGVDMSPDMVERAEVKYPLEEFVVADLRSLPRAWEGIFDWAVLVSIRPMVKRHLGDEVWAEMERELRRVAKSILYLEYDENDEGVVE